MAESRPLYEGRELTARLLDAGLCAACITDAQIGAFMRGAQTLLLGADTICADLAVVKTEAAAYGQTPRTASQVPNSACTIPASTGLICMSQSMSN